MNWFDILLLSLIGLSVIMGYFRGFSRELLSILTWIAAIFAAFFFAESIEYRLQYKITNDILRQVVSYGGVFLAALIVGGIFTYFVSRLLNSTVLGSTDRLLGIAFGTLRGVVIASLVVFITDFSLLSTEAWWQQSSMVHHLSPMATWFGEWIPSEFTGVEPLLDSDSGISEQQHSVDREI